MRLLKPTLALVTLTLATLAPAARAQAPATAPTAAAPPSTLQLIDADAPFVAVLRPRAVTAVFAWLGKFDGALKPLLPDSAAMVGEFGVDLTGDWAALGIDPETPIAGSFMAIDVAAAEKAFHAMVDADPKKRAKAPRMFWRTRIVAKVTDEKKAQAAVAALAASPHGQKMHMVVPATAKPDAVAAIFGADAKQGKAIAAALKKLKIAAVGYGGELSSGGHLVFLRVGGGALTIDVVALYGGGAFEWKLDAKELAKVVGRKAPKGGATAIAGRGAGKQLAEADAAIWIDPVKQLDTGKAMGWQNTVIAYRAAPPDQAAELARVGGEEVAVCDEFRAVATGSPFEDLAFTARVKPAMIELGAVWGLRANSGLPAALATTDDGLVDLTAGDAAFMAVSYLKSFAPLRALPRPGILAQPHNALEEKGRLCGFAAHATVGLFGWPYAAAMMLDAMAAEEPELKTMIEKLRNIVVAAKSVQFEEIVYSKSVFMGSFDEPFLHAWFGRILGKPSKRTVGRRSIDVWKPGRSREPWGFAWTRDRQTTVYGIAFGAPESIDWFWGRPSPSAAAGAPPFVLLGRADLPKVLAQAGTEYRYMKPWLDDFAKRTGNLGGSLGLAAGDTLLVGTLKLEIK